MKNLFLTAITFFGLASITMAQVPNYVPTSGLVVYYPFSGNANDQSGNGFNGIVSGANLTTDRFGNTNSAYNFVGSLGSVITSSPSLPTGNASRAISVWVKTSSVTGGASGVNLNILVNWGINSFNNMSEIYLDLGVAKFNTFAAMGVSSATNISNNAWHNVVSTYDNNLSILKIYVDGVLKGSSTATLNTTPSQLYIGERNGEFFLQKMDGVLDDIGIWNRALTPCEVTRLYNASVITTPTITAIGSTTLCSGKTATLTTSTVGSYTWSNGANTQSITVNNAGSYSVSVTTGSCIGSAAPIVISVNPTPTITVNSGLICLGQSFTMLPSGASTYTYSSGSAVVSPITSTSYSITGTSSLGCVSSNTAVSSVTVNICTGINQLLTNSTSIYPNPNHGLFTIELNETTQVMITDVFGQVILTETVMAGKQTLDIKNHANGIYFVKLIKDGKQQTIKLIKE